MQATWTSPISNRVLFESGYSDFRARWGDVMPEGAITNLIPVTEQSTNAGVPFANYLYRGWLAQPSQRPEARHLARVARLRVGQQQPEVRLSGRLHGGEDHDAGGAAAELHVQQRLADSVEHARRAHARQRPHPLRRVLRPGCLDPRAPDAAGRAAFRDGLELGPGRRERRPRGAPVRPREHLSPHGRRDGLPRPHAARRRRVRPVRQRQDRRQGELRTSICRACSRARPTRSRTRRRRSSRASRARGPIRTATGSRNATS